MHTLQNVYKSSDMTMNSTEWKKDNNIWLQWIKEWVWKEDKNLSATQKKIYIKFMNIFNLVSDAINICM